MFDSEPQNYYKVLDVRPDAGQNEIRQAYFRVKSAYGKDSAALYSLFDESESRRVLELIEQAYLVLSNHEKRKEYDKIHGFLRHEDLIPSTRKAPTHANVFTFGRPPNEGGDPAQQAAHTVFGAGSMSDMGELEQPAARAPDLRAPNTAVQAAMPAPASHDDYSTPRTLASHGATGPPVQEYSSRPAFSARENRLGIVRRTDLVKGYEKSAATEEEISRETSFRGEFFRKVREYKRISIEELAEFTKISKTYINCIECEEFESLPAPAYLRGFVAQIAKALKLQHEKAASSYMAHYRAAVMK